RNSLAGVVRAHGAARQAGLRLVIGARLDFRDCPSLLCLPNDRAAYGRLCRLLTLGRRRAPKGECHLDRADLAALGGGHSLIALAPDRPDDEFASFLKSMDGDVHLAAQCLLRGDDAKRLHLLAGLAAECGTPLVATNDVHAHAPARRPLMDVLTCIREHCTIDAAGWRLEANAERHLKSPAEMARLFAAHPEAVARSVAIAERCRFGLDELRYEYPVESASPQADLERLTAQGAAGRWPEGVPAKVQAQIAHELRLIDQLGYAPYFLTVHDIVAFARSRGILCQGRGSAANSAVCFCLGITAVDPARSDLLFERFVSAARDEPPDIDVDFEHERREEVIQYIYRKWGRDRAGLAATVITWRGRSAMRDVGKALGLPEDVLAALSGTMWGSGNEPMREAWAREAGLDPSDPRLALTLTLAEELKGFPRHLSQHVGGFVLTRGPLSEIVPIENAAMADRTVIQWDKDDLDTLGILKIDVLALGMLSCVRKAFELVAAHHGRDLTLADVPAEDPAVYDMLCKADSVGVFQVESRAQMTMLPRLRPRTFHDLVVEVAIVRPGPIQGDMVHPYLRRRMGKEAVDYPSPALRQVLEKTLGVPLFQEQAMRIAMVGAGFSAEDADRLRRAMAAFRRPGLIAGFRGKFISGMIKNGYALDFATRCFGQIEGFGQYGFPESHAASFAILVYVSAWLKCHYPAAFACALLNSQPMGFYAPAQIVRDARAHGVEVRPVCVNASLWDNRLEPRPGGGLAVRLGFRQIKGCAEADAAKLVAARPFRGAHDVWWRAGLSPAALEVLAQGDAFGGLGLDRRAALWAVKGLGHQPLPLFRALEPAEPEVVLPALALGEQVVEDYESLRLTLRAHPLALLRRDLDRLRIVPAARLATLALGKRVAVAGLVTIRQRPGTASGIIFLTMEDESGTANVIIRAAVFERFRRAVLAGRLIRVDGRVQREGIVIHLLAETLEDLTPMLARLVPDEEARDFSAPSRDFH
ncbi:MAG: error-prone DNA polymerase, partial [Alphaproteobacteria bacterium]|nr:error-prone DNA polymerase [Alphaproteobacteria bacterium]